MNIDSFRYLIAVEEYGSISSASRHLFSTQPALTKQILKLESELGGGSSTGTAAPSPSPPWARPPCGMPTRWCGSTTI